MLETFKCCLGKRGEITIDFPTFLIVNNTFAHKGQTVTHDTFAKPGDWKASASAGDLSVQAEVPAKYLDPKTGRCSTRMVREIHRKQPRWDNSKYIVPLA